MFLKSTITYSQRKASMCAAQGTVLAAPLLDEKVKDVMRMVLSPKGSYVQQLLVDELVSADRAQSRLDPNAHI